jgi:hypothetical protein
MKTFRNLLPELAGLDNLWLSWLAARKGKRRSPMVAAFELDAERYIMGLHRDLTAQRYRPQRYRLHYVTDPKRRLIAAAPFHDRVVQHAVVRVAHPRFGRSFIDDSYACLPGRGSHRAVIAFLQRARRHRFVMKLDVVRYFPSVPWDMVISLLARRTNDDAFLALMATILESAAAVYRHSSALRFLDPSPLPLPRCGLPIGSYTSQWLGNFYLDGLDHFVKRCLKARAYQRYMDDMTLFSDSKQELHAWRDEIAAWLAEQRCLQIHTERAHPRPCKGHHKYLGYIVSPSGIRPGPRIERRMRQRLPRHLNDDPERLGRSLASYRGAYLL